jgi:hypothetical protein
MKREIDIKYIYDIEVDGVNTTDYPDFCDAYFSAARWEDTGEELTDSELDELTELYPELLNEMAFDKYI